MIIFGGDDGDEMVQIQKCTYRKWYWMDYEDDYEYEMFTVVEKQEKILRDIDAIRYVVELRWMQINAWERRKHAVMYNYWMRN